MFFTLPAAQTSLFPLYLSLSSYADANRLCHTDIHMRDNDWGISDYPIVLGHEGVGIIRKIGSSVKTLKVGDRVGVSWIRDSCQCCDPCLAGRENICEQGYQGTYLGKSDARL